MPFIFNFLYLAVLLMAKCILPYVFHLGFRTYEFYVWDQDKAKAVVILPGWSRFTKLHLLYERSAHSQYPIF